MSQSAVGDKMFCADVLRRVTFTPDRSGFEPEIAIKIAKLGCRVYEVPIRPRFID